MAFGIVMMLAGVLMIVGATKFSGALAAPNEALGARAPSRASFVLVGVGFIIIGIAALFDFV